MPLDHDTTADVVRSTHHGAGPERPGVAGAAFEILEDGAHVTDMLVSLCRQIPLAGKPVHDASIVAAMLAHGECRLLTFNASDFRRHGENIG